MKTKEKTKISQIEAELEKMREFTKKVSASKKSASEYLAKTGIYTQNGKLSRNYR